MHKNLSHLTQKKKLIFFYSLSDQTIYHLLVAGIELLVKDNFQVHPLSQQQKLFFTLSLQNPLRSPVLMQINLFFQNSNLF